MTDIIIFVAVALALAGLIVFFTLRARSKKVVVGPPEADVVKAIQIIWYQTYGAALPPPRVDWVTGSQLNCHNGTGWLDANGQCVAGNSRADTYMSAVAWVSGELLSDTALAHELLHQYLNLIGEPDPNHEGPAFGTGGLLERANEALRKAGL